MDHVTLKTGVMIKSNLLIHQKFSCAIIQINYFLKHYKLEMVYKYSSNIRAYCFIYLFIFYRFFLFNNCSLGECKNF